MTPHIEKRRPKQCKEVIKETRDMTWPDGFAQEVTTLGRLIGKYQFKEAEILHESIIDKLKTHMP